MRGLRLSLGPAREVRRATDTHRDSRIQCVAITYAYRLWVNAPHADAPRAWNLHEQRRDRKEQASASNAAPIRDLGDQSTARHERGVALVSGEAPR
jgi:hypothetical protein